MPVDPTGDITDHTEGQCPARIRGRSGGAPRSEGPAQDHGGVSSVPDRRLSSSAGVCCCCAPRWCSSTSSGSQPQLPIWGPIHGALFVVYVIIAFDLAYKDRWSPLGTLWVLVAGTIPFVSFVAERQVQRKVLARQKM